MKQGLVPPALLYGPATVKMKILIFGNRGRDFS